MDIFKLAKSSCEFKSHFDDDYVDRLSRQYTIHVLLLFALLVTTKQFLVGSPINCWCPAGFTPSNVDYANAVCFGSSTYALPTSDVIPAVSLHRYKDSDKQRIGYYQWVPLILIFESFLSYAPCLLWGFLNKRSGINLRAIMDAAGVCAKVSKLENRETFIRHIVHQMDRYLLTQREYRTGCCVRTKHFFAKVRGHSCLSVTYLPTSWFP